MALDSEYISVNVSKETHARINQVAKERMVSMTTIADACARYGLDHMAPVTLFEEDADATAD